MSKVFQLFLCVAVSLSVLGFSEANECRFIDMVKFGDKSLFENAVVVDSPVANEFAVPKFFFRRIPSWPEGNVFSRLQRSICLQFSGLSQSIVNNAAIVPQKFAVEVRDDSGGFTEIFDDTSYVVRRLIALSVFSLPFGFHEQIGTFSSDNRVNASFQMPSLPAKDQELEKTDSSKTPSKYIKYLPVTFFIGILIGFFVTLWGLECFYNKRRFLGATLYLVGAAFAAYGFFGWWL